MLSHAIVLFALYALGMCQYPLLLLYQFPSPPAGPYVNIENIAVRRNGQLILTSTTGPTIYSLDPASPTPQVLVNIPSGNPVTGIAETYPGSDIFIVATGTVTVGGMIPPFFTGNTGSWSVYAIDLNGKMPVVTKVVSIPAANLLNGITSVSGLKDVVLIADSGLGAVWSVNVKTGTYQTAIQSSLFTPTPDFTLGINGVHARDSILYFTNSGQRIFGKIQLGISSKGVVGGVGSPQVIASVSNDYAFDDFALDKDCNAWVATPRNAFSRITPSGQLQIVAGGGNSTTLVNPTSAAFASNGCILYITTGGNGGPGPVSSGQIFYLNICKTATGWKA